MSDSPPSAAASVVEGDQRQAAQSTLSCLSLSLFLLPLFFFLLELLPLLPLLLRFHESSPLMPRSKRSLARSRGRGRELAVGGAQSWLVAFSGRFGGLWLVSALVPRGGSGLRRLVHLGDVAIGR
jgi:hypothetical protein